MEEVEGGNAGAMPAQESAIGNLADLGAQQVLLPAYIERHADGLMVGTAAAGFDAGFRTFVERVFSAGALFVGLDYAAFQTLLFGEGGASGGMVRLANDIRPFRAERRALYRGVKLAPDKSSADYMFEPVEIEVEAQIPVFGPAGADGTAEVIGEETVKRGVPTRLDPDEFVAAMWEKNVRFGLDMAAVRGAIESNRTQRLEIARMQPPTPGKDASVEEKTEALHRDDAPRILPDGRMDLRQFKNRFPQIAANVRLLQKMPRVLGKPGFDVTGGRLEPDLPKDFDLGALAGPGTRLENGENGEFIVSARDGFIDIDRKSNQLSVTEKIVSREGVSMKTTGDIALTGDEFEEHGEVQERRVVEGCHMTFHADVFGKIVSRGGRVVLKSAIAGGTVESPGGAIRVEGRASRATLDARDGEIFVEHAEGCTIIGGRVTVNRAVKCDILGEQVQVGLSQGSAIAGKFVHVRQSTARKEDESFIVVLVPDTSRLDREAGELEESSAQAERQASEREAQIDELLTDAGFKQYLALSTTIARGEAKLSAEHEANWRKTQARFAPQTRLWQANRQACAEARKQLAELKAEIDDLAARKKRSREGIACSVDEVLGSTLIRRTSYQPERPIIAGSQAQHLIAHLREFGPEENRLFWGEYGGFEWNEAEARPEERPAV
jgi:hypothetical protein